MDITALFSAIGIFCIATTILVKSADTFIDYIEKIGHYFRLPHFITGVLLVAIGTSLPEFSTSLASVFKGETAMLAGNVLGTVIANICLGLGLMSFISQKNITFKKNVFSVHFPIFIFAVCLVGLTVYDDAIITQKEGIFFLATGGAYMWYLFKEDHGDHPSSESIPFSKKMFIIPFISLIGLIISSEFVIRSVIDLAGILNFSKTSLSATLIAIGTSLPEMIVVFTMLKKKFFDMAVGNILGSNIFDILLIFGIGSQITPLEISTLSETIIIPFMAATLFIYWGVSINKNISKYEGLALTIFYALFLGKLFGWV